MRKENNVPWNVETKNGKVVLNINGQDNLMSEKTAREMRDLIDEQLEKL